MSLLINALALKEKVISNMKDSVSNIVKETGEVPKLVIINASDDFSSKLYIKNKVKIGEEIGVDVEVIQYDSSITTKELGDKIKELNTDKKVTSMILQLPLYEHLNKDDLIPLISPLKDCDGFSDEWLGKLIQGKDCILPCTPKGVMSILKHHNVELVGKDVVVVGKSAHVGLPLSVLLAQQGATTTIAHSRSNLEEVIRRSDVIISCVGKYDLIKADWIKEGAVIVGVGYSRSLEGKLATDYIVDEVIALNKASLVGSVTNNTGLATVLSLFENVIQLWKIQNKVR